MPRSLRLALLAIAVASTLAGAVIAILPALALALVHLFYDSAGGVLILLGNLLILLQPAFAHGAGGSSLPVFQMLEDHLGMVLFRSLSGAILCSMAFAILINDRGQERRFAWPVTACCAVAALIAGHNAAVALVPAIAVGLLRLARSGPL